MAQASAVLTRARSTLQDEGATKRWSDVDLLLFVSDSQRELVILKPSANAVTVDHTCVAGTRQEIPADGVSVIAVNRAVGGLAVRLGDRSVLDAVRPQWHTDTADIQPDEWLFDDRDPRSFWLNPGQPDPAGHVELVYAASPTELAATSSELAVSDVWIPALNYYVVGRALSQEKSEQQVMKAVGYMDLFRATVEGRQVAKSRLHPTQTEERMRK